MGYVGYTPAAVGYAGSRGATGYTGSLGTQGSIGYTGSAGGGNFSETNSTGINTLSSVQITGTAGQISFTANPTDPIAVNDLITLSGTEYGTQTLTSIFISGTGGQFGCTTSDAPIVIGQTVTISGTKGGSGSITGYSNPKTYYVIDTDGSSAFTLSETPGGSAITTTTGVPSGLTFTNTVGQVTQTLQNAYITGSAGQFYCNATTTPMVTGQTVKISGTKGGSGSISGYSNPTTYYIIATNGSTTLQLSATPGGSAISTSAGLPTGLTYTNTVGQVSLASVAVADTSGNFTCAAGGVSLSVGQIIQVYGTNSGSSSITGYSSANAGQTYYVKATNGTTYANNGTVLGATTFQLSSSLGGAAITTTAGSTDGLSFFVRGTGSLQNYNGTTKTYYVKSTNGTSTAVLSETVGGDAISSTVGAPFGVTYTCNQIELSEIATASYYAAGYGSPATTGQFTCSPSSRQLANGQKVRIYGTNSGAGTITGYTNPTEYYIIATDGSTKFTLSATKNGAPITTTVGTLTGLSAVVDVGQNLISFAYTVGKAMVYVNGVKLIAGVDYTATNGTTIELVNGIYANDYITLQTM